MSKYEVTVGVRSLRLATKAAAMTPPNKAGFKLACKLLPELFTTQELASSKGQGLRNRKEEDLRPALDQHKMQVLRGMIIKCPK